ncbi:SCO family protein [Paenibacillus fonticola]|uniref:SCO family protein n=1 Tax=Paenibacillus fonticola TaxID=379896 RepID=UPI000379C9DA|nr:SCO family protein [Paenibacillus fonticola]
MKKMRRMIDIGIIAVLVVAAIVLLTASLGSRKPNDLSIPVESFEFINQESQPFGLADLEDKVWVAHFMFTNCSTVCPTLTANMAKLQRELQAAGLQAELVSFTVDPEKDTPEALKKYIGKFTDDFDNWHALTGYSFEEMQAFGQQSFKSAIQKDAIGDQVIHGISFYLVDRSGTIVTRYDGQEPPYSKIIKDIKALSR